VGLNQKSEAFGKICSVFKELINARVMGVTLSTPGEEVGSLQRLKGCGRNKRREE